MKGVGGELKADGIAWREGVGGRREGCPDFRVHAHPHAFVAQTLEPFGKQADIVAYPAPPGAIGTEDEENIQVRLAWCFAVCAWNDSKASSAERMDGRPSETSRPKTVPSG